MNSPIDKALIKIFAKGFYKAHSGLLLFLFAVIFIHCFWMKPLGGHLTDEQSIFYHLIMVISFANDPVMMLLVFIAWLVYTYKSWGYVGKQMKATENLFLFYSITSMSRLRQFRSYFIVQSFIALPAIVYGLFTIVIGIAYHYYTIPIFILLYLLLLLSISAIVYVKWNNQLEKGTNKSQLLKITKGWKKPFFSLYLYYVLDRMKLAYGLTKFLSLLIISGSYLFFADVKNDFRLSGIVVLLLTISHSFLIFQSQRFEKVYLAFARNLPYYRKKLFLNFAVVYLLLILPEIVWLVGKFDWIQALELLLFALSTALIFRSLLYYFGVHINKYLPWVFSLFILYFLTIMFAFQWILPPLNFGLSYWIFYRNYYRSSS